MNRRVLMTAFGASIVSWPLVTQAQQAVRTPRIGMLLSFNEDDLEAQSRVTVFRQELARLGWSIGHNIQIDYRWSGGDAERLRANALELIALGPNVIVAAANTAMAAVYRVTRSIPVVFASVADPVAFGYVVSVPHPDGNVTGFATSEHTIVVKRLELLKEIAPRVRHVGFVYDP